MSNLSTREILENQFNGLTPIKRQHPKFGETPYFYINPNTDPSSSLSDDDIANVHSPQDPNPFLQSSNKTSDFTHSPTLQPSLSSLYHPTSTRSNTSLNGTSSSDTSSLNTPTSSLPEDSSLSTNSTNSYMSTTNPLESLLSTIRLDNLSSPLGTPLTSGTITHDDPLTPSSWINATDTTTSHVPSFSNAFGSNNTSSEYGRPLSHISLVNDSTAFLPKSISLSSNATNINPHFSTLDMGLEPSLMNLSYFNQDFWDFFNRRLNRNLDSTPPDKTETKEDLFNIKEKNPRIKGKYAYYSTEPENTDELIDRIAKNIMQAEGKDVRWAYIDPNRYKTVGPGFLVKTYKEFEKYPFYKYDNNVTTNTPISDAERKALWKQLEEFATPKCPTIKNFNKYKGKDAIIKNGKCIELYQANSGESKLQTDKFGKWRLRDAENVNILRNKIKERLKTVEQSLKNVGVNIKNLEPWAIELIINGYYNSGLTPGRMKGFANLVKDNNWSQIAQKYCNKDIGSERCDYYQELVPEKYRKPNNK